MVASMATIIILSFAPQTQISGQASPTPKRRTESLYSRYAQSIQTKADSVIRTINQANAFAGRTRSSGGGSDSLAGIFAAAGKRMRIFTGDFDAVTPPSDFDRLHDQLVAPLKQIADKFERMANLLMVDCSAERSSGRGCDEPSRQLAAREEAMDILRSLSTDIRDYGEARDRAKRMLADHRVTLPDLES